jgi:hypothetical protein
VSEPTQNATINRRHLLLGAVFLVGGAAALTRYIRDPAATPDSATVFSPEQYALLEQVVDVIIPRSDTPGALDVGVPAFMHGMLSGWASPATRASALKVLDVIERQAWNRYGAAFRELPAERRLAVVSAVDAEALSREDPGYRGFKWLVLLGYYHSEAGATQELRYELVPGAWRSCLPLTEVGRASAV